MNLIIQPVLMLSVLGAVCWMCWQSALGQAKADAADAPKGDHALTPAGATQPVRLQAGPHLFLDDYLIAGSEGVTRKVESPKRFLKEPVVTGKPQHQNWQPFHTVLHDPAAIAAKRFRMWYNVDVIDDPTDGVYAGMMGYMESADGINWPGPYKRLDSLTTDGRPRFGASVIDDGPGCANPAERYKIMYNDVGRMAGPRVAASPDGVRWKMLNDGKPIFSVSGSDDIWTGGYDPIRKRYFLIGKVYGPHTWTNAEGQKLTESIRRYGVSFSQDFKTWSKLEMAFSPDEKDSGITQWYGVAGLQTRGDLIIGFLRVLRDDKTPQGAPADAVKANTTGHAGLGASLLTPGKGGSGMGYTVLTWTRDGKTWHRDRHTDPFFEPDPTVGAWDHAMSWVGSAAPVGDEVYLYYAGYKWGHKYHHSIERQIGMVKIKRDRYVARHAGADGGKFTTRDVILDGDTMTVNADASAGQVLVQVCDDKGTPIPGLTFADCKPITADSLAAPVQWKGTLASVKGKPVRLEFSLKNAAVYAFELSNKK